MSNATVDLERLRGEIRSFVQQNLPDDICQKVLGHQRLIKSDFMRWHRILYEHGWGAPNWPEEFGGTGWDVMERHIFDEECALAGAPEVPPFGLRMVAPVIMKFGTAGQQKQFLPRILNADQWWCQGYSEPGAGSDLASLRTKATLENDHFLVNGHKTWTTYAQYADMMFCLVRTGDGKKPQEGISFLLIDMSTPGITVRPIRTIDGDTEVNDVYFDNVRVPLSNLVGPLNEGWTCAKYLLSHERFGAARVGRAKRELSLLKKMAARVQHNGLARIADPAFAEEISRLEVRLLALEHANLRLIERTQRGEGHGAEASILKLMGTSLTQSISEKMVQVAGKRVLRFSQEALNGEASTDCSNDDWSSTLAGFYLNLRKISIYGGTDEIQRGIIAKFALGL